jgi:hypothetical protein
MQAFNRGPLAVATALVLGFVLLALLPYLRFIGLALLCLIVVCLVGLAFWFFLRLGHAWYSFRLKRLEVARKREQVNWILADPGQKVYGIMRDPSDPRILTPLVDPQLTIVDIRLQGYDDNSGSAQHP